MSQTVSQPAAVQSMTFNKDESERKHRFRILVAWIVSMGFVAIFTTYGLDYYTLASRERPFSPKHMLLRPSGPIGVNLGVFGVLMFFLIYLYPLRKRWGWLGRQGNSRHWLDFHVVLGTAAPLVIANLADPKQLPELLQKRGLELVAPAGPGLALARPR